jgi:hypothetical protein
VDSFETFYRSSTFILSSAVGIGAIVAVLARARSDSTFLRGTYLRWVAVAAVLSIAGYLLHPMVTHRDLWGQAVFAYAMLGGLLIGGVLALVVTRPSKVRSNNALEADREP